MDWSDTIAGTDATRSLITYFYAWCRYLHHADSKTKQDVFELLQDASRHRSQEDCLGLPTLMLATFISITEEQRQTATVEYNVENRQTERAHTDVESETEIKREVDTANFSKANVTNQQDQLTGHTSAQKKGN